MPRIVTVPENGFEEAVLRHETVVVDFFATWCGGCRALEPAVEQLARCNPGIRFVRVDVDDAPTLVERFGIRSLPTLIRFDAGTPTTCVIGAFPTALLADRLHLRLADPQPRALRRPWWSRLAGR
ncbi:MAG: thioredoxin family protein [Solirubrobacteraceae bacterium]